MHRAQTKAARWPALMLGTVCTLLVVSPAQALTPNEIEHIANRLGFGARPEDRIALAPLNREKAVSYFLRGADKGCEAVTVPGWAEAMFEPQIKVDEAAQKAFKRQRHAHKVELQAWWLNAIVSSPAPLCERMAMFWHEYFPIQVSQTRSEIPIVRQVQRFRRQWAGDFGDMLKEMSRDAAMMEYLQLQYSHRRHPNENYARGFLELYTLGPGHYSEVDVREAARAYTGWRNLRRIDQFLFWWPAHDFGEKTFLGQTGLWDGDDIVDIVLAQPRTAEYVVEKFWHAFISPTPDPFEVRRLAAVLRHHWQIRTLLKAMFRSPAFWADVNRNTLVKTPIDLVVGSLRQAGAT